MARSSSAYYPLRNVRRGGSLRQQRANRSENPRTLAYFQQALQCLQANPERVAIIKANLDYYEQQPHLPKSAHAAIKRFQYLLAVTDSPADIERWLMEDSQEGRKFRQLPLLLKGVCDEPNKSIE